MSKLQKCVNTGVEEHYAVINTSIRQFKITTLNLHEVTFAQFSFFQLN